jgi:hypothetical protein
VSLPGDGNRNRELCVESGSRRCMTGGGLLMRRWAWLGVAVTVLVTVLVIVVAVVFGVHSAAAPSRAKCLAMCPVSAGPARCCTMSSG